MGNYRHIFWKDMEPGDWIDGVWERAPRHVEQKTGRGYYLGELRTLDGTSVGFTLPVMLEQQLLALPLGSGVRIKFLGSEMTGMGYNMWRFHVETWPPKPKPTEQARTK